MHVMQKACDRCIHTYTHTKIIDYSETERTRADCWGQLLHAQPCQFFPSCTTRSRSRSRTIYLDIKSTEPARLSTCLHVCMYVWTWLIHFFKILLHPCMYVCMCVYVCMVISSSFLALPGMFAYKYVCMHVCFMHVCMSAYEYACMYALCMYVSAS